MKNRKHLHDHAKQTNKTEDWAAYSSARNEVMCKLELAHIILL